MAKDGDNQVVDAMSPGSGSTSGWRGSSLNRLEKTIGARWRARHHFELIGDMLLGPSDAEEDLRLHHELASTGAQSSWRRLWDILQRFTRNEQGEAHFEEVVADEVKSHIESNKWLRAFFWTVTDLFVE